MHDVEQYHMPYFGNVTIVDSSDDPKLHGDFYAKVEKLGLMARYGANLTDVKIKLAQEMKSHLSREKTTLETNLKDIELIDSGLQCSIDSLEGYKI
jgi:hypothetical protein